MCCVPACGILAAGTRAPPSAYAPERAAVLDPTPRASSWPPRAKKEGGNGWKTSQRRLRFLEKNSIVMCRGNADMIRRATPYQKAVAIRRAG